MLLFLSFPVSNLTCFDESFVIKRKLDDGCFQQSITNLSRRIGMKQKKKNSTQSFSQDNETKQQTIKKELDDLKTQKTKTEQKMNNNGIERIMKQLYTT